MGTIDYMAPEQVSDAHKVDIRADVYSLGCTLYHLLAGRVPFADSHPAARVLLRQEQDPRAVEEYRPDVPPALPGVLRRMLARRAEDRYQTPAEAARALQPFIVPAVATSIPTVPPVPVVVVAMEKHTTRSTSPPTVNRVPVPTERSKARRRPVSRTVVEELPEVVEELPEVGRASSGNSSFRPQEKTPAAGWTLTTWLLIEGIIGIGVIGITVIGVGVGGVLLYLAVIAFINRKTANAVLPAL
jgi:serine/threonine protein kinase